MTRSVLITGASRGIGEAIVQRYASGGFRLLTPSREEMDLSSAESVRLFLERHGDEPVDVLVNNAGENKVNAFEEIALGDWERILSTNLTAAFLLMQHYAPRMAGRGWGRIVNVSSAYSFLARPGRAAYAASKGALNGITRTAALEYGSRGVLVNAIAPGFVETEMTSRNNPPDVIAGLAAQTALGRLAQPAEIAQAAYFLGSDENTYITGQVLVIDGGFSIQ